MSLQRAVLAASVLLLASIASAQPSAASRTLTALAEREWTRQMERNPIWASLLGDHRFGDRWDDVSLAALAREAERDRAVVRELETIDVAALSPDERTTRDLLRREYAGYVDAHERGAHLLLMHHMAGLPEGLQAPPGVHGLEELAGNLSFEDAAAYTAWQRRLETVSAYVDGSIALLRAGIAAKLVHPKVVTERVVSILDAQLAASPESTGFLEPYRRFPARIATADQQRLATAGREAHARHVLPSLRRFRDFMAGDYLAAAPKQVGVSTQPGGTELYAYLVRHHTTTPMTPDQVHELGLAEVTRIRAEMETVKARTGFKGTLPEFFQHLRTDPRFFYKDAESLLAGYRSTAKMVDPRLVKLFTRFPRMPYGVEPTPAARAAHATTGFYFPSAPDGSRAGTFQVNVHKPESRPKWEMVPLTLHEAVPGHHLQVSLAAEVEGANPFRRLGYYTAYGEGWGLYSEWLGHELGLYSDPYDHFGQLTWEMWRAVRLVVDTGMHARGWTRERAIEFFMANTARPQGDVVNEVDRYLAMPGQALAYKIGQIRILALRTRAEKALGPAFDVRAFHDEVLGAGSLPLDVLETRIDEWIARRRAGGN